MTSQAQNPACVGGDGDGAADGLGENQHASLVIGAQKWVDHKDFLSRHLPTPTFARQHLRQAFCVTLALRKQALLGSSRAWILQRPKLRQDKRATAMMLRSRQRVGCSHQRQEFGPNAFLHSSVVCAAMPPGPMPHCAATTPVNPQPSAPQLQLHAGKRNVAMRSAVTAQPLPVEGGAKELLPGFTVVIAGAGISGLTLALGLLKKGIRVQVLERDLTAVRGEGKLRGPIQVQSNALAALEAIDPDVAEEVMREGCITGDRINGLCDGVSGDWYVKFDTFHPAADRGLPITRVISRITLQEILAAAVEKYGGPGVIQGGCHVVGYEEVSAAGGAGKKVCAILEDGRRVEGDVLVGTDGIWSKIRKQLLGDTQAHYSEYTCYTGISDYVPADIDLVGYRVFLGNGQYFVSSDVGEGKMQWYAFHQEPAGGEDEPGQRKARLLKLFGHWNYNVVDLIKATPEEDVLRRDIFDRPPVFRWTDGRVALMGDSAHAMQPNLGQGGCMAIEDAFELVTDLVNTVSKAAATRRAPEVEACLKQYQDQRVVRVSAIHGMAGMAAMMASTYKAYLGEGLGPLSFLTNYHIPHPGRVAGQVIMKLTMPFVLGWVLGGNTHNVETVRVPYCKINDKPRHFAESEFGMFMRDDEALAARANADWLLVAERVAAAITGRSSMSKSAVPAVMAMAVSSPEDAPATPQPTATTTATAPTPAAPATTRYGLPPYEYKATFMNLAPVSPATGYPVTVIGSSKQCQLVVEGTTVAPQHAQVEQLGQGRFLLRDMGAPGGTYVNGTRVESGGQVMLHPGDALEFGAHPAREVFQVKLQHPSYRTDVQGDKYQRVNTGAMSCVA